MKHSRIFLGFTSTLLAIIGIAAAKAHRNDKVLQYYYTKIVGSNAICTKGIFTACIKGIPGNQCLWTVNHKQFVYGVYTQGSSAPGSQVPCATPLKYNAL